MDKQDKQTVQQLRCLLVPLDRPAPFVLKSRTAEDKSKMTLLIDENGLPVRPYPPNPVLQAWRPAQAAERAPSLYNRPFYQAGPHFTVGHPPGLKRRGRTARPRSRPPRRRPRADADQTIWFVWQQARAPVVGQFWGWWWWIWYRQQLRAWRWMVEDAE